MAEKKGQGEKEFEEAKKKKTAELMKKNWDEQLQLKVNEEIVERIFI